MPKSSEPTVPLYDSSGNFIGELATNSSRIAVKDKSGDEVRHDGTQFVIDSGVDTPSVSTEELVNGAPLVTQSHRLISERLNSLDGVSQETSGSGTIQNETAHMRTRTNTTGDSHAIADMQATHVDQSTFDKDVVFRAVWSNRLIGSSSGDQGYVAIGPSAFSEDTYTAEHLGFGYLAGDLVATSGDGTSQETTVITASVAENQKFTTWVVWDSDNSQAEFFVDTLPVPGNSPDATQSTNVPSTSSTVRRFQVVADNDSNGNDNATDASEYAIGVGR